jgi:hypothetical protein
MNLTQMEKAPAMQAMLELCFNKLVTRQSLREDEKKDIRELLKQCRKGN